ncbi:YybH family protein [Ruegeria arenilitoris]|uniref:YybH family protein n=1 Tax=Ruegeria arenilitoris TaxID=1173585 RepID=UPI00147C587C|nr:nuclear transport factor 2 family protein [Ruegeria arenilitoris]
MVSKSEIESIDEGFFSALNAMFEGDIGPMEALWSHADDVIYMGPSSSLFHVGWKVTDQDWVAQGQAHLGGSIKVLKRHVFVADSLATVHHFSEVTGQGDGSSIRMRGTNIYRNEDGVWKLIAHHSDPLPYIDL